MPVPAPGGAGPGGGEGTAGPGRLTALCPAGLGRPRGHQVVPAGAQRQEQGPLVSRDRHHEEVSAGRLGSAPDTRGRGTAAGVPLERLGRWGQPVPLLLNQLGSGDSRGSAPGPLVTWRACACLCLVPMSQFMPWLGSWRLPCPLSCCAAWAVHSSEIPPNSRHPVG